MLSTNVVVTRFFLLLFSLIYRGVLIVFVWGLCDSAWYGPGDWDHDLDQAVGPVCAQGQARAGGRADLSAVL